MARILIVDDEPGLRETLALFLRRDGHEVATAGDVPSALGVLVERPVDVVLADLVMPGESGLTLLARVREAYPTVQVVLVTGEPSVDTAAEALRLGAFDYLSKPVRRETLARVVERAVQVKALSDENRRLDAELRAQHVELESLVAARTGELTAAHEELEGAYRTLRLALDGTVQAMARMAESRDPYTAGHQRRVAALAEALSDELRLEAEVRETIALAAVIHDIGKIGVPAEILAKPTRLSAPERHLIEQHPAIGYTILAPVAFPWPIAEVVHAHHERLDGSGYPRGLAGDAIRIEARVLAVADVVEAISSDRPYRAALGLDVALTEIERGAGSIYDVDVVRACVRLFRERGFRLE
jgi:response regulator RpfG family c-di-GMP phosphodiesterase